MSLIRWFKALFYPMPERDQSKKHVSICIGHSRIGDKGASSVGGVSEWVYNRNVAYALKLELLKRGFDATIFSEYPRKGYTNAMKWLASEIKLRQSACCIELHFNSADRYDASGFEYLFLDGSVRGERFATFMHTAHSEHYTKQEDRGIKGISRNGRGYGFVKYTPCPAVIAEPFFGSNVGEWNAFQNAANELAEVYANGIEDFLNH